MTTLAGALNRGISKARKHLSEEGDSRLGELVDARIDEAAKCVRVSWERGSRISMVLTEAEVRPRGQVWVLRMKRGKAAREFADSAFRPLSRLEEFFSSTTAGPVAPSKPVDFAVLDKFEHLGESSDLPERLKEVVKARDLDRAG